MQSRLNALHQWLITLYPSMNYSLVSLIGDASFRRYYRLNYGNNSYIVMDTPPDKIKLSPFIDIQALLSAGGIKTPKIYALEETLGFALLEDFGDILFSTALTQENPNLLYTSALRVLLQIQPCYSQSDRQLPVFDQSTMLQELSLFTEWFLQGYLGLSLEPKEQELIEYTFQILTSQVACQPQVMIHRDYHSRNIMLLKPKQADSVELGIIDFQDAGLGPFTYDLVSLLKDCYIKLPNEQFNQFLQYFYDHSSIAQQYSIPEFHRAVDWCGLQRHIRILGTFCRLHLRDAKSSYLNDLPRVYQYVIACLNKHSEFATFGQWLEQRVAPCFDRVIG